MVHIDIKNTCGDGITHHTKLEDIERARELFYREIERKKEEYKRTTNPDTVIGKSIRQLINIK